jgi:regulator of protease activity HflC (stomatin/prohibitin superfamily)
MKTPFATRPSAGRITSISPRWILGAVVLFFLVSMAGCMTSVINSGHRGVRYSSFTGTEMGKVYGEGLQVLAPWQRMVDYEVRVQNQDERIEVLASNGATIGMDVSVRYYPDAARLPLLHTTYGPEYYERLVRPVMRSISRQVVGRYTPEQLYSTRRTELQTEIEAQLRQRVGGQFVILQDVLIRDVRLPDQVRLAIERKLQEEQRAEQVQFSINRTRLEAERKAIEAEGQATYQRLITQSLSPQYLQYEGIQATRALAESENAKVVVIGGDGNGLPIILGNQ